MEILDNGSLDLSNRKGKPAHRTLKQRLFSVESMLFALLLIAMYALFLPRFKSVQVQAQAENRKKELQKLVDTFLPEYKIDNDHYVTIYSRSNPLQNKKSVTAYYLRQMDSDSQNLLDEFPNSFMIAFTALAAQSEDTDRINLNWLPIAVAPLPGREEDSQQLLSYWNSSRWDSLQDIEKHIQMHSFHVSNGLHSQGIVIAWPGCVTALAHQKPDQNMGTRYERGVKRIDWDISQVLGKPNTPFDGDVVTAWASATPDGQDEWLVLHYGNAVKPSGIEIHETYNPGAVHKVSVLDQDGNEVEVWEGQDPTPPTESNGISMIPINAGDTIDAVKIYLDSQKIRGWNEIDAVALLDEDGGKQWAVSAEASSIFGQTLESPPPGTKDAWAPKQATGKPDTLEAGDIVTAWASATPDGQEEWLLLEYTESVIPSAVHIYETYNPGAVIRICILDSKEKEVEVWRGIDPTPIGSGKGVSKIPITSDFKIDKIKIYIDSANVTGWNEIDAVGLLDVAGEIQWAATATASTTFASR